MADHPREISILIMEGILKLITAEMSELEADDPARLRLVEFRPRSEDFADQLLSCSIAPNDPDDPGGWEDTEITRYPSKQGVYEQDYGRNFNEMGGGQGFDYRFSIGFRLFYNEMDINRETALASARIILARIKTAIMHDRIHLAGLRDDFGSQIVRWDKGVKTMETTPAGSAEETFVNMKMKLSFEVYQE
jgi:hypothetical protein